MRIRFDDIELSALKNLGLPFDAARDISEEEYFILYEKVADAIIDELDENYDPTSKGKIYERIMDKLSQL
ncbi:MAG: hypothetical protein IJ071_05425 [Ruminococcus sp.]|nr:hypothetical protein [Ruminococcus sp.]